MAKKKQNYSNIVAADIVTGPDYRGAYMEYRSKYYDLLNEIKTFAYTNDPITTNGTYNITTGVSITVEVEPTDDEGGQ